MFDSYCKFLIIGLMFVSRRFRLEDATVGSRSTATRRRNVFNRGFVVFDCSWPPSGSVYCF